MLPGTRDIDSAETGLLLFMRPGVISFVLSGSVARPSKHRNANASIMVLPIVPDTLIVIRPTRVAMRTAIKKLDNAVSFSEGLNLAIKSANSDTAPHSSGKDEDLDPTPIGPISESLLNEPRKLD